MKEGKGGGGKGVEEEHLEKSSLTVQLIANHGTPSGYMAEEGGKEGGPKRKGGKKNN